MKISAIQNTFSIRNIKNSLYRRAIPLQASDCVSFCAKKYNFGDDFLEITKGNENMRDEIARECLLDKNKNIHPTREGMFVSLYYVIRKNCELPDEDVLSVTALALKDYEKPKIEKDLLLHTAGAMKLREYGFSMEQIENVFDSDFYAKGMPGALAVLQTMFGDEMSFVDKKAFLIRYCRAKDGSYDLDIMSDVLRMFKTFGLKEGEDDIEIADFLWEICLDDDYSFNRDVSKFIVDASRKVILSCAKERNSHILVSNDSSRFKKMLFVIVCSLICQNRAENNDRFDPKSAQKSLDDWLQYVVSQGDSLNDTLKILSEKDNKYISIRESFKQYPNDFWKHNNIAYKFSCLLSVMNDDSSLPN